MQMPIFEKYIQELLEKSTLDVPAWNIEKAQKRADCFFVVDVWGCNAYDERENKQQQEKSRF